MDTEAVCYGAEGDTSNHVDHSLKRTVKNSRFKDLGELHKVSVIVSRATKYRCLQDRGYNYHLPYMSPLLDLILQKHLTWAKMIWTSSSVVQSPLLTLKYIFRFI